MPPDPRQVADTKAWLDKAALDLRAAEHERNASPPLIGDLIIFHAQQLVGETLKAFMNWHDQPFRKTHSPVELGRQGFLSGPFFDDSNHHFSNNGTPARVAA